jgi:epsin
MQTHRMLLCVPLCALLARRLTRGWTQNWRHVTKALNLLDYLVKNGSDQVVDYANRHIADIKTLKARTHTRTERTRTRARTGER